MGSALGYLAKKIAIDFFSDPGKFFKALGYILLVLFAIVILLALPVIIITSFPVLLFNAAFGEATKDPAIFQAQLETIAIYQNAPINVSNLALEWIEEQKEEYSWCDDIVVNYGFNLTWQDVMSIDAVLFNQDFSDVTNEHVMDLGGKFVIRSALTEEYQAEEQYQEKEEYAVEESYFDSASRTWKTRQTIKTRVVTKTRIVTRTRAVLTVGTKPFSQVVEELGFTQEQQKIATNMYETTLLYDVEGQLNIYDDIDLSDLKEYPPGSAILPYFNQTDKRWAASMYGTTGTIASGGCGPTSLAMVVSGLTGRGDINPKTIADWSVSNGHRAEGNGSYWSLMTAGGVEYGLEVEAVSRQNPSRIVEALSNGQPVIAAMGRGHFTNGGHFIVLYGLADDGKVLVYDPISVSRSNKAWDLRIILNESSTNGGVNGSPFWVFK